MNGQESEARIGSQAVADPARLKIFLSNLDSEISSMEEMPLYRASHSGEQIRNMELVMESPDGRKIPVLVNAAPIHDIQGNIVAAISTWLDITDRKRIEEAIHESERRERERAAELAALFDATPTPVFIAHDPECHHITGNPAADALLRNPPGSEASLSAPEEIRPRHFQALKDGLAIPIDELPSQRAARGELVKDFWVRIKLTNTCGAATRIASPTVQRLMVEGTVAK